MLMLAWPFCERNKFTDDERYYFLIIMHVNSNAQRVKNSWSLFEVARLVCFRARHIKVMRLVCFRGHATKDLATGVFLRERDIMSRDMRSRDSSLFQVTRDSCLKVTRVFFEVSRLVSLFLLRFRDIRFRD